MVSKDYSINNDVVREKPKQQDDDDDDGESERNDVVNSYVEPDHEAIMSMQRAHHADGIHSEAECKI